MSTGTAAVERQAETRERKERSGCGKSTQVIPFFSSKSTQKKRWEIRTFNGIYSDRRAPTVHRGKNVKSQASSSKNASTSNLNLTFQLPFGSSDKLAAMATASPCPRRAAIMTSQSEHRHAPCRRMAKRFLNDVIIGAAPWTRSLRPAA